MLREMEELFYPPIAEAEAVLTGTVMSRLALARRPLQPAWTEVKFVGVGPEKETRRW